MIKQKRLEFVAENPGFEKSKMYGHLFKNLTKQDLAKVEWLRLKRRSEAHKWVVNVLKKYQSLR